MCKRSQVPAKMHGIGIILLNDWDPWSHSSQQALLLAECMQFNVWAVEGVSEVMAMVSEFQVHWNEMSLQRDSPALQSNDVP